MIFCSFGDMLRVPGSSQDLFRIKSEGGDVRVVYSPLDALKLARENPDRQVVFFGIGFETTAPANAMTVYQAKRLGIENFSLLVRTCWCRRPSPRSWSRRPAGCRRSSPPGTSAA